MIWFAGIAFALGMFCGALMLVSFQAEARKPALRQVSNAHSLPLRLVLFVYGWNHEDDVGSNARRILGRFAILLIFITMLDGFCICQCTEQVVCCRAVGIGGFTVLFQNHLCFAQVADHDKKTFYHPAVMGHCPVIAFPDHGVWLSVSDYWHTIYIERKGRDRPHGSLLFLSGDLFNAGIWGFCPICGRYRTRLCGLSCGLGKCASWSAGRCVHGPA